MNFLLALLKLMGSLVEKLVPIFLAYRAGVKDAEAKETEAQNDALKSRPHTDNDVVISLRDTARRKREDQS